MRKNYLILLFMGLLFGIGYVLLEWGQRQAFVYFSRKYVKEVNSIYENVRDPKESLLGRKWLSELYYVRRWELLNQWALELIKYNQHLHLRSDFVDSMQKALDSKPRLDLRNIETLKFYVLELKNNLKRLPKAHSFKSDSLWFIVSPQLMVLNAIVSENRKLSIGFVNKISEIEGIANNLKTNLSSPLQNNPREPQSIKPTSVNTKLNLKDSLEEEDDEEFN